MLKRITFTGLDDNTSVDALVQLEKDYADINIEWGILFGGTYKNRYPTWDKVNEALSKLKNCSAHLCGAQFREVYENPIVVVAMYKRFGRLQLNFNTAKSPLDPLKLNKLFEFNPSKEFVLQYNKSNKQIVLQQFALKAENFNILFDASGGRGKVVKEWPKPICKFCSYSGGLGPDNLASQLSLIQEAVGNDDFGIDMESNVRTDNNFDTGKIEECLKIVRKFNSE